MQAAPWIAVYLAVLIAWTVFLASRTTPTLWKGRALGVLNGAFVLVALATALVQRKIPDAQLMTFLLLMIVAAGAARNVWLLLHIDRAQAERILEKCFAQTRATHERTANGYTIQLSDAQMNIAFGATPMGQRLRFEETAPSKKASLIRALIGKQFTQGYPTVKIRT